MLIYQRVSFILSLCWRSSPHDLPGFLHHFTLATGNLYRTLAAGHSTGAGAQLEAAGKDGDVTWGYPIVYVYIYMDMMYIYIFIYLFIYLFIHLFIYIKLLYTFCYMYNILYIYILNIYIYIFDSSNFPTVCPLSCHFQDIPTKMDESINIF